MTAKWIHSAVSRALDASILCSFDRSGFKRHATSFDPQDLEVDLAGRICLVTGANSGIGLECSAALAERGATVWMLCRDQQRGRVAARDVRRRTGSRTVHLATLDISNLADIRRFLGGFAGKRVDVLVHNAGVLPDERGESVDGLEITFATHVAGPWLLTTLLAPRMRRSPQARVIFVSSGGMYTQKLSLEDWAWRERPYDGVTAYAQTKRMQVVIAEELARRLRGDSICVNAMHPGWADTPAVRTSLPRFWQAMQSRLRSPAEGADTVIWLATSRAAGGQTGLFWFDRQARTTHLLPWTRETAASRRALLRLCESVAGGARNRRAARG